MVHRSSRHAFTLVELLVVIGIIALLISILLPSLNRARESANKITCMSNMRQLAMAFLMYTEANQGKFPGDGQKGESTSTTTTEDWIYYRTNSICKKISDPLEGAVIKYLANPSTGKVMHCPSETETWRARYTNNPYAYSYVVNSCIAAVPHSITSITTSAQRITQVKRSAEKILLYEEDERTVDDGKGDLQSPPPGSNTLNLLAIRHDMTRRLPDTVTASAPIDTQINKDRKGNVALVGGHVEYVERKYAHDPRHYDPAK